MREIIELYGIQNVIIFYRDDIHFQIMENIQEHMGTKLNFCTPADRWLVLKDHLSA